MAKQHFLIPARLTRQHPLLRRLSWLLEAAIVKFLVMLIRLMPPKLASGFATSVFVMLKPLLPFTAKIHRNLTVAFPEKNTRELKHLTRSVCGNLGKAAVDLVLAQRIWVERDNRIEFVLEEGVNINDYRDRPAVMVTGHIGAWQIASYIASQYELRITSIYAPETNPYLRKFILRLRSALPCRFVSRDGCMRHLTKELNQGHVVGLASDTRLDCGNLISFFGEPAPTNTTAARLALHHNCDLLPVHAERLPDMTYRITLFKAIQPDDTNASVPEKARQMTQTLSNYFEAWIQETPEQWMCFSRRWPHEAYTKTIAIEQNLAL